jgi:DNA-binding NarL/FixJ family response regulator
MNAKNVVRVILADDHAMIRRGLRKILEKGADILVIAEAGTGADAIHLVKELKPDVLVLDIEMPDMKGDIVARELRSIQFPVAILILSAFNDRPFIEEILQIGVDGYLTKGESPERIRAAIRDVSEKPDVNSYSAMLLLSAIILWNISRIVDTFRLSIESDLPRFFN